MWMRLRRNTFAAATWSESEIVRCFAAAGHLSEEDRSLRCLTLASADRAAMRGIGNVDHQELTRGFGS
jgi:hypothetical protein